MKVNIFSPIIVILIIILSIKAIMLIDRVQEQTVPDNYTNSVLIDTAYAKDENVIKSKENLELASQNKKLESNSPKVENNLIVKKTKEVMPAEALQEISIQKDGTVANISNAELHLLKELSKRRRELDKTEEAIVIREQVLKVTENKIDQKIAELELRQAKLEEIMKQYDQKEHGKILSLVKIYENMKPREAAKIFDELEMPILLEVVSKMKEIKVAPVIASMNPIKARDLSIEMARAKVIN